jgi:hypothetical protein
MRAVVGKRLGVTGPAAFVRRQPKEERMALFFKPYDLFYDERENKSQTRCVESFTTKKELLDRVTELKAIRERDFVIPDFDNLTGATAQETKRGGNGMKAKTKKVVMYLDGVRSVHKDVVKEALAEYVSLDEIKRKLTERVHDHVVTFKVV